jgi:iron complex outermembrane receptor protein
MRSAVLSIILVLLAASLVFSQEIQAPDQDSLQTSEEPKYTLTPMVVTATRSELPILRVPYAIDVIDQREIQRSQIGLSLDKATRAIPGIVLNNRHNLSRGDRISIRGVGSRAQYGVRGVKIILDGIPLTLADGQSRMYNLDLGSTGTIEVLRGPCSSLYGNASGGVINITTQSASPLSLLVQPQLVIGSHGYRKWQAKVSGNIGRHSYLINVNKVKLDGYREHSAADMTALNAVVRHTVSNNLQLISVFNFFDAPYLLNPSSLDKADALQSPQKARDFVKKQGTGGDRRQGQAGVTFKYGNDGATQFEANLYGLMYPTTFAIPGQIGVYDEISGGLRSVLSKRFSAGSLPLRLIAGVDVETQSIERKEYENLGLPEDQGDVEDKSSIFDLLQRGPLMQDQDENVLGIGSFAELELSFSSQWLATLGGRYDRYRFEANDHLLEDGSDDSGAREMDQLSPKLGLVYRLHDLLKFYGHYSTAYQTPSVGELGNISTGRGGFNPDLDPEIMTSFELGANGMSPVGMKRWPGRRLDYSVSLYILTIEDMLIPFQVPDQQKESSYYRNAGKAENRGIEIKFDWYPARGLRTTLTYTLMDFVFKDFEVETTVDDTVQLVQLEGNEVPGVPPHQIFAGISFDHPIGAYSEVNLRWVDQYFANDFNGPPPGSDKPVDDFVNDSYTVVDFRLGIKRVLGAIGVGSFVGIDNLFDERYNGSITPNAGRDRFFEPAAGRTWFVGINLSYPRGGSRR